MYHQGWKQHPFIPTKLIPSYSSTTFGSRQNPADILLSLSDFFLQTADYQHSKLFKMDATHLHLLLNHFPIIGSLLGVGVMAYGYITSSEQVKKAALWTWFVMALIAIPVFLTGEPAEESVEGIAGVSEALIEEHEEAAELAIWLMEALGLLSLVTLIAGWSKNALSKPLVLVATVLSLVTFGAMARTGYLGGQIRHTEIRSGVAINSAAGETNGGGEAAGEKDDD